MTERPVIGVSEVLPTEGNQHHFVSRDDDDLRCRHCDGYPFDLLHWCTG
jgi:hypothetical protein